MKIPETTPELPYIEFRINEKGTITLSATVSWWGGKSAGFTCSDGSEGNTCKPKDLDSYIKAFKARKIKSVEKQIALLQKQLAKMKSTAK